MMRTCPTIYLLYRSNIDMSLFSHVSNCKKMKSVESTDIKRNHSNLICTRNCSTANTANLNEWCQERKRDCCWGNFQSQHSDACWSARSAVQAPCVSIFKVSELCASSMKTFTTICTYLLPLILFRMLEKPYRHG